MAPTFLHIPPKTESPRSNIQGRPKPQQEQQNGPQNKEKLHLKAKRNIVIYRRRFALWFKTVYLKRKEYVPGDTCRFIWQKAPDVQRSFVYYRIFHVLGNLVAFGFSFLHVGAKDNARLCKEPLMLCIGTAVRLNFEWFFFATSVGLVINLVQSVWGLVLAAATYCRQTRARKGVTDVEVKGGATIDKVAPKTGHDMGKTPRGGPSKRSQKNPPTANDAGFGQVDYTSIAIGTTDSTMQDKQHHGSDQQGSAPSHTAKNPNEIKGSSSVSEKGANPSATKEHEILSRTGFYWALHTYSICASLLIDTVYWTLVWPRLPTAPAFHLIQFIEHGLNLPLMITEYCVVAFPVACTHLWFTTVISLFYILWNFIWYSAGGKNDDRSKHYLYPFMDWKKPGVALTFGIFISLGLTVFLFLVLLVDHYKFKRRPKVLQNVAQNSPPLP